jgi:hypothetical protein
MAVETIGEAYSLGWRVTARCVHSREDGPSSKSSRQCTYRKELDMETLVCTRGRAFSTIASRKSIAMPAMRLAKHGRDGGSEQRGSAPLSAKFSATLPAAETNCRPSSLLDGREQPIAATRAHEGPQFGDLAPLAAFDGASARALDHVVVERKFHGHGRIIGIAFAPGFR